MFYKWFKSFDTFLRNILINKCLLPVNIFVAIINRLIIFRGFIFFSFFSRSISLKVLYIFRDRFAFKVICMLFIRMWGYSSIEFRILSIIKSTKWCYTFFSAWFKPIIRFETIFTQSIFMDRWTTLDRNILEMNIFIGRMNDRITIFISFRDKNSSITFSRLKRLIFSMFFIFFSFFFRYLLITELFSKTNLFFLTESLEEINKVLLSEIGSRCHI